LARPAPSRPTDAELAILSVLWARGPSTVRAVCDALSRERRDRAVGYTTVLKLLQIMHEKGLVTRDERQQSHVYRARHSEQHTQRLLVRDLADRAFGGSVRKLVLGALSERNVSADDMERILQLLEQVEKTERGKP
jgi:predicted transcriptional regulator